MENISDLLNTAITRLTQVSNNEITPCDVMTGFKELDCQLCGFDNGDLIVVGARPGVGKTSFVLSCALNNARAGVPLLFYSFDMTPTQIVHRLLAATTGVDLEKIRAGQLIEDDWNCVMEHSKDLYEMPLHIECGAPRQIDKLCEQITQDVAKVGARIVYIDYLQLLECNNKRAVENRYQEVATFSRSLKTLARQLNIPVVVTSQLNRRPELRQEVSYRYMRPNMYDLRDSGTICEDANLVLLLDRPEMFYRSGEDLEGNDIRGLAEVIVAKHNNGRPTETILCFDKAIGCFKDQNEPEIDLDNSHNNSFGSIDSTPF